MTGNPKTFAELYEQASDADKAKIRQEIREGIVEIGLLLSRLHSVSGGIKDAFSNSMLLNDMTQDIVERRTRFDNTGASPKNAPLSERSEDSESKEPIEAGMHVEVDRRKGGKYAGHTGTVRFIIGEDAILDMEELNYDVKINVSLLHKYEPEEELLN